MSDLLGFFFVAVGFVIGFAISRFLAGDKTDCSIADILHELNEGKRIENETWRTTSTTTEVKDE